MESRDDADRPATEEARRPPFAFIPQSSQLSPEAAAQQLQPYLLQGVSPLPHVIAFEPWAVPPSQLAFYEGGRSNVDPVAVLDQLERDGLLLGVEYTLKPSGPLFVPDADPDRPGRSADFRLWLMRDDAAAAAFVDCRARPLPDGWPVQPLANGPALGEAARWFRCDPPHGLTPIQISGYAEHMGHQVRWRRGPLAFSLRMGLARGDLPGFIDLAQQLDAIQALKPPLRPMAQIIAPATERERLDTLLRLERLLNDPALDEIANRASSKYARINAPTPAQAVLRAAEHAAELHRHDVGWQRVAALRAGFVGPARTLLRAEAVVDATAEAARRDLHAPPVAVCDAIWLLPNTLALGDETVTTRVTRQRPNNSAWWTESIAWTHGRLKLVASASGPLRQTDWSLLGPFAEALEAAYQRHADDFIG